MHDKKKMTKETNSELKLMCVWRHLVLYQQ